MKIALDFENLPMAPNAKGPLLLPWMLNAAPDALTALIRAAVAASWSTGGVVARGELTVTGADVRVVGALAVSLDLVPLTIEDETVSVAGLAEGSAVCVGISPALKTVPRTWMQNRTELALDVPVSAGRLLVVPGDAGAARALGVVPLIAGNVRSGVLDGWQWVDVAPTARGLPPELKSAYSPTNPVPLSDGFGPAVPVPDLIPFTGINSAWVPGQYRDFTPERDVYLVGLRYLGQSNADGTSFDASVWEVASRTSIARSAVGTVQAGRIEVMFGAPVRLKAGVTYRIGFNCPMITQNAQANQVLYPGFIAGGTFDDYNNRHSPRGQYMPDSGSSNFTPCLLIAGDFKASGVVGRLTPAALPRSTAPLALADGEAYILAVPGAAPEIRTKESGVEYKAQMVQV